MLEIFSVEGTYKLEMDHRRWKFKVQAATGPGEVVCITGSCPELGEWDPNKVVPMVLKEANCDNENVWHADLEIPDGVDVKYRFVVCVFPQHSVVKGNSSGGDDGRAKVAVVKRWETGAKTRKVSCHDVCTNEVDTFGLIPNSQDETNKSQQQRGWLVNETLVQLKLHGHNVLQIWKKKHQSKDFYLKVTPVETSKGDPTSPPCSVDQEESVDISHTRDERKSWPIVEVVKATDEGSLRHQNQFGVRYEEDSFILFQAQVLDPDTVAFLFDVFARPKGQAPTGDDAAPEHIGSGYVLPEHFKSTEGRVKKPIISKRFQPVGQFTLDYLVIRPMDRPLCNFKTSFSHQWKPNWKGLEVAHRGLGNSYTMAQHCSNVRENTIASMKDAVEHGADMIEFDVQVSKDLVPVIYHEFELCASITAKNGADAHLVDMPVKNLTLNQLQHLKTHHPHEKSSGIKVFSDLEDHQPFPTLEKALQVVDSHAGFNIELKWDMELADGRRESHNAFELNLFVDTILQTVLAHGNKRKIVFSSFNPDICTVVRYKQNKYPVLFLTSGECTKYDKYHDKRTHSIQDASNFVETTGILGVSVIAEEIQRDPSQVQLVKGRGQVLFCWTDDQNNPAIVQHLKSLGVDGVIYDRIDVNSSKEVKQSIFLMDNEEEEEETTMGKPSGDASSKPKCSCSPQRDNANKSPFSAASGNTSSEEDIPQSNEESNAKFSFSGIFNKAAEPVQAT